MKLLIPCWIFRINGTLSINEIEKAFKELNINIDPDKSRQICKGLDFHEDEQIKYTEFLALWLLRIIFKKKIN